MARGKVSKVKQKEKLKESMNEFIDLIDVRDPTVSNSHIRALLKAPSVKNEIYFSIPFSNLLSKNAMFGYTQNRKFIKNEVKKVREKLTLFIAEQTSHIKFDGHKIWIDILVVKPKEKFDAANFIDGIFDCIKEGIGIDDRVFSMRRLDWSVNPEMPEIIIGIADQGTEEKTSGLSFKEIRERLKK